MMKPKTYIVTVTIRCKHGDKPDVRSLGGDTVFIALKDGQTAKWVMKAVKPIKKA